MDKRVYFENGSQIIPINVTDEMEKQIIDFHRSPELMEGIGANVRIILGEKEIDIDYAFICVIQ